MAAVLGGWAVPRRVLLLCTVAAAVLLAPLAGAYLSGGVPAALAMAMAYIACARPALTLRPSRALSLAVPAAMAGAVAVAVRGQPVAAACLVALCCLLVTPASIVADALMAGVPGTAAVLVLVPGTYDSTTVALWMLLGGAVMVLLGSRLPVRGKKAEGLPAARAWRHGIVMAVAVGLTVWLVALLDWPHGYWLALTLTLVLRPFDDQTLKKSWQRVLGTVGGVLLALALATVLPLWGVVLAVGACQVLSLAYTVQADYARQVALLTPTVVLLGSSGSPDAVAAERALYTIVGALVAVAISLALARYDRLHPKETIA
jgi:hypothetical protein